MLVQFLPCRLFHPAYPCAIIRPSVAAAAVPNRPFPIQFSFVAVGLGQINSGAAARGAVEADIGAALGQSHPVVIGTRPPADGLHGENFTADPPME
jgi:hypothetical protein